MNLSSIKAVEKEALARKMHEWYLEATQKLNPKSYNPNAQKSYDDLTFEQQEIDRYIAVKVLEEIENAIAATRERDIDENTSDGYHTFKELYEFRKLYNAALFNEWARQGKHNVHKSKRHNDGEECFGGGWFIVMATLPTGQISNHYELSAWDMFHCEERERADEWDGHTAQDVAKRLAQALHNL